MIYVSDGFIIVGNVSGVNDGVGVFVLMFEEKVVEFGKWFLVIIFGFLIMGMLVYELVVVSGFVINKFLKKNGLIV